MFKIKTSGREEISFEVFILKEVFFRLFSKKKMGRLKKVVDKNQLVSGLLKEAHGDLGKIKAEIEKFGEPEDDNVSVLNQTTIAQYNWMVNVTAAIEGLKNFLEGAIENFVTTEKFEDHVQSSQDNFVTATGLGEQLEKIDKDFSRGFNQWKENEYHATIKEVELELNKIKNRDTVDPQIFSRAARTHDEAIRRIQEDLDHDYDQIRTLREKIDRPSLSR